MPAKNSIKQYLENGFYHIYNRGVEKRKIFLDEQDYRVFLSYFKDYLLPKDEKFLYDKLNDINTSYKEKDKILKLLRLNNFFDEISLLCYCLMSNHFHFLIRQNDLQSIDYFMNSLGTRYTMYFNRKYKRVGPLYQERYKAVMVTNDEQLLYLSAYIHRQSLEKLASQGHALQGHLRGYKEKQPSSFLDYLGLRKTPWIKSDEILSFFTKNKNNYPLSYEAFVLENNDFEIINDVIIEK